MKIVVMGAGGLGCYIGGQLMRAGRDVTLVARGAQLQALSTSGLEVRWNGTSARLPSVKVTGNPDTLAPADLIILAVKAYDLVEAIEAMRPIVGPETLIFPILNGVDHVERLNVAFGPDRVLGGLSNMTAHVVAPGIVERLGQHGFLEFGEQSGGVTARSERVAAVLAVEGLEVKASDTIVRSLWQKFAVICGVSVCSVVRGDKATIFRGAPETTDLARQLASEVVKVGQARGIDIADAAIDSFVQMFEGLMSGFKPSMLVGLERGQRIEVEALSGAVVRMGRESGVPTPANAFVYACLKPHALGRAM